MNREDAFNDILRLEAERDLSEAQVRRLDIQITTLTNQKDDATERADNLLEEKQTLEGRVGELEDQTRTLELKADEDVEDLRTQFKIWLSRRR